MGKFQIVRRFSLEFLGEEWKGCYLDFTPITIAEFKKGNLGSLARVDVENPQKVQEAFEVVTELLKNHLVKGRGRDNKGRMCEITREDFDELPAEVVGRALDFLSQTLTGNRKLPSVQS